MPAFLKFLIGLAAALAGGVISHGPLGQGEAYINGLQAQSDAVLREAGVPGVTVRFPRHPLRREAILSGPADDFQREGQGLYPGLNDRIGAIAGVADLRWDDSDCCGQRR